jgi:hypothetical protein
VSNLNKLKLLKFRTIFYGVAATNLIGNFLFAGEMNNFFRSQFDVFFGEAKPMVSLIIVVVTIGVCIRNGLQEKGADIPKIAITGLALITLLWMIPFFIGTSATTGEASPTSY